jgi:hypothetical protein
MTLESSIEGAVGRKLDRWVNIQGYTLLYLKLNILGIRGFPDRLILFPHAKVLFVEFKRQGEKPRKLQEHVHKILGAMGFEVKVYDNVDQAVSEITSYIAEHYR